MREQIKNYGKYYLVSDDSEIVASFIERFLKVSDLLLELGSGNGIMAKYFDERTYFSLDPIIPDNNIFNYIQGVAQSMPLKANSFDITLCKDSLSYYRNLLTVLDEASRVVKKMVISLFQSL